jgi:Ricin-type beta-trefoil lectin domain-like/HYR domain/Secretion system C-terminal sorting domain
MKRNFYILIAMLLVCLTPLSMQAFGTTPSANNKTIVAGCEGVTVTGGSSSITVAGLGSYSHIQVFTPGFASQVFNQEITTASITVPVGTGDYIVKIWSNPNPAAFCESNFPVTVGGVVDPCTTDATAPTFTNCPSNINLTTTGTCTNASWTTPTATDNCSTPTVVQTSGGVNGFCAEVGITPTSYTATDAKGNVATCSFNVVVTRGVVDPCATDATAPTFTNCPTNINLTTTGTCANASWTAPSATDNCSAVTVSQVLGGVNGSCFAVGTTLVKYMATDAKGNSAICVFNVVVTKTVVDPCATDAVAPVIVGCPANIVKTPTAAGSCWNVSWTAPTATDNCSTATVTQTAGPANGSCIAPGTYTVTYKATDAKGNSATCSFTVTVKPYLNCTVVTGNTIAKACTNNVPTLNGSALAGYEYVWLRSTTGCPTLTSQAIAGATGQHYTLPSRVTSTTYFVRCARQIGCTTWGRINESNCVTVYATDCVPATPVCSVNFSSTKCYKIVNKRSGKVLDVYAGSCNNNTAIKQYGYHGGTNQQWRLKSIGSGYFKFVARNCGKVLACHTSTNGENTYQYDYYTGGAKDWKIECAAGGYYRITHRLSGKVLDVEGDSNSDNAAVEIRTHDGTDSQLWQIVEVACNTSSQHLASNDVLDMNAAAEVNSARIQWVNNTGYKNDFFTVEKANPVSGDFEQLSVINSDNATEENEFYSAYDNAPTEGDNTYRVKVTYMDGTSKTSAPQTVKFNGGTGIRVFPNPASETVVVDLSKYKGEAVTISMYNQFGQQVLTQQVEKASGTVNVDISQNAVGNYLLRVVSKGRKDAIQQLHIAK